MKFLIPRRILWSIALFSAIGVAFSVWLRGTYAGTPDARTSYNAFYVVFARDEVAGLLLLALFCVGAAICFFRTRVTGEAKSPPNFSSHRFVLIGVLTAVFAITALGVNLVCHDYALSSDEFLADFQAQIFLRGEITAPVPARWQPAVAALKPTYVDYLPARHAWKATYLPVYAAMRALFQEFYLQDLLNPALAVATLLALYGTVRNIWPNEKQNALVAVFLLGASAQFLVMAMTSYSMPAHLALNTIWLWLYSRPDRRRFYLAPVIGVLAIGLHEPVVHALFVAPFLFRLVRNWKWRPLLVYGALYSLGCVGWYCWRAHYLPPGGQSFGSVLRWFNPRMLIVQPMDLWLVLGWSCLATPLLVALGCGRILGAKPIVQDAALSCLLTFGFYYFFYLDQGYGWGYRYFHGALSCFILVAVAGWRSLGEMTSRRTAWNFLAAGVAVSLLVALPLRCWQTESFIRPFARASAMIHSSATPIVGVNVLDAWYSADLVRNDPFLEDRPIVAAVARERMTMPEIETLQRAGPTRFITRSEFQKLGLSTLHGKDYRHDPFGLGRGE